MRQLYNPLEFQLIDNVSTESGLWTKETWIESLSALFYCKLLIGNGQMKLIYVHVSLIII